MIEGVIVGAIANLTVDGASAVNDRLKRRQRQERISEELAPIETEFAEALGESLKERAWDLQSDAIRAIATNWELIVEEIDAYEIAFEDEEAAVEWLVTTILECEVVEVDLSESEREEVDQLVADAYADALEEFRERVATDDELAHRLQTEFNIELLERLDRLEEIQTAFERLADSSAYRLYDFPEEREAIVEAVDVDRKTEFVDRSEVPDQPETGRHFVLGPSGSGKSRVIAERLSRLPDDTVTHVLVPEEELLDTDDARALARESFDGDLVLVWEDLHRVDGGREDGVVRNVLQRLDAALEEQGYRLHALLEAQTGRLDDVFGNLPKDFENKKSLWHTFEPLWLGEWEADRRRLLVDRMAAQHEVTIDETARDALVERTEGSASAPVYIETVFKTVEEQLTAPDVNALADEVAAIWERQYDHLRETSRDEWRVLVAMKYLHDMEVPQYSELVYTVFTDHLDANRETFRTAVEGLLDRQWVTVVGDDLVAQDTRFRVHDTQLAPIRVSAADDAHDLARLIRDAIGSDAEPPYCVPLNKRADVLFYSSTALLDWRHYELAAEQWEETLRVDSDFTAAHVNYATLLQEQLDQPAKAEEHYLKALRLDPEDATAHSNYAHLFRELDRTEEAIEHVEKALQIDSDYAAAHGNYARLLDKTGRPEQAEEHYKKALDIDPDDAVTRYNFAKFLGDAGRPEEAAKHFEAALRARYTDDVLAVENPEITRARTHANYAFLLHNDLDQIDTAEDHFEQALELDPDNASAHANYARLLEKTGRPEQAEEHYQEALSIDPDYLELRHNYGSFLRKTGRPEAAAEHFEAALQLDSRAAPSHREYANLLHQQLGKPEAAKEHYEKALELDPDKAGTHNGYAVLLQGTLDQPEVAAEHFEEALQLAPDDPMIHHNYGTLLVRKLGHPEEAKEHLEAALELDLEDVSLHHNYALLVNEGLIDPAEAESHYQKALELDPEHAGVHADYALLLHEDLNRPAEAQEHYEKALEYNPDDTVVRSNYAHFLHSEIGDSEAARDHLDDAIQRRIDEGNLKGALNGLKGLITVCLTIGDDETIVRACDLALDLFEYVDTDEEMRLFFESQRLLARSTDADTIELYAAGLNNVIMTNWDMAITLLDMAWERHGAHASDSSEHNAAVSAGLVLAAQLELFNVQDSPRTVADILDEVPAAEVPFPASVLYEQIQGESPERGPDELRGIAKSKQKEGDHFGVLQLRAVAKLVEGLC